MAMTIPPSEDLDVIANAVLWEIYRESRERKSNDDHFTDAFNGKVFSYSINERFKDCVAHAFIDAGLQQAVEYGWLTYTMAAYQITHAGIRYAQVQLLDGSSTISRYNEVGLGIFDGDIAQNVLVPASDRTVTLNHNSAPYREAIHALDKVMAEVRGDNVYGDEAPEEKEQLLANLTAGRRLLDSVKVNLAAAQALIFPALRYAADKWAGGAIGATATMAMTLIAKLFGIL